MNHHWITFFCLAILSFLTGPTHAKWQEIPDSLDNELPIDSRIKSGRLSNGLKYYILEQPNTEKIALNLVVKAGSNNETEGQLELAHLIEHLPFVRTKHFKSPREYFASQGLKFGEDVNAKTRPDHTWYFVQVPDNNESAFDSALLFLRDCAHDFTMSERDIDKERGVILGEMQRATSISSELAEIYTEGIIPNNALKKRTNSARKKNVNNFNASAALDFFNKWYTPENQFLLVVGKVEVNSVTEKIEQLFSNIQSSANQLVTSSGRVAFNSGVKVQFASHSGMKEAEMQIHMKSEYRPTYTYRDLQISLVQEFYNKLMANRLADAKISGQHDRLGSAFRQKFPYVGPVFSDVITTWIGNNEIGSYNIFKTTAVELERVRRYGFTEEEVQETKKIILRNLSRTGMLRDNRILSEYYVDHILEQTPATEATELCRIQTMIVKKLTSTVINSTVKEWMNSPYIDIVFLGPPSKQKAFPVADSVLNWFKRLPTLSINPYVPRKLVRNVSHTLDSLVAETSLSTTTWEDIKSIGARRAKLINGITVVMKNTPHSEPGVISLTGVAPGGLSLFPDSLRTLTYYAPAIVTESGIGDISGEELVELLSRNEILAFPYVGETEAGFYATFSESDIALVLQAICGYMAFPKMDGKYASKIYDQANGQRISKNSNGIESEDTGEIINHAANLPSEYVGVDLKDSTPDAKIALAQYKRIFGNTLNFTFVITGNFSEDVVQQSLVRYLSTVPQNGAPLMPRFWAIKPKYGVKKTIYSERIANKASVQIKLYGNYEYSQRENLEHDLLLLLMQKELAQRLRVELGGTYDISVSHDLKKRNPGFYIYTIYFESTPERVNEMIKNALSVVEKMKSQDFINKNLDAIKMLKTTSIASDLDRPGFWESYLKNRIVTGEDLDEITHANTLVNRISSRDLSRAAKKWFVVPRISIFKQVPEKSQPNELGVD